MSTNKQFKRIIPCLDIKDGRIVKGVNFVNLKDIGDPVETAKEYELQGADELVFLDIAATHEERKTFFDLIQKLSKAIEIPFAVGGGISELADAEKLISLGTSKVSINSAAIKNPKLITEISKKFGSQACVCAIDAQLEDNGEWMCYIGGGRIKTDKKLLDWAKEAEQLGAGEILFTSMSHDGVKSGYPNEALFQLSQSVNIPIIASGGAGSKEDFKDAILKGNADAVLAASVFHFGEIKIPELKAYLKSEGIDVRL